MGNNPSWNYTKNGEDWNMTSCNLTGSQYRKYAQSPRDIVRANWTNATGYELLVMDWGTPAYYFNFIPKYRPSNISWGGAKDFVYQINITDETPTKGW